MKENNLPQEDDLRDENAQTPEEVTEKESNTEEISAGDMTENEPELSDDTDGEEDGETDADQEDAPEKPVKVKRDTRRLRYGGMATGLTAAVIAAVVLLNIVAGILNDRFPLNLDLTKEKLFTISSESKTLAKNIKTDTKIIVFSKESTFSAPNTGEDSLNAIFKQFYEVTKDYDSLSGGKIKTSYVDLVVSPTEASKYAEYDATDGDILFVCGKRTQKATVNELFTYDQQAYSNTGQLSGVTSEVEKTLTVNLAKVTSDKTPVVTLLKGHSEDGNLITSLETTLKNNNYTTESLDITTSGKFNESSTLAIIPAPETDYSADEIAKLRTWISNGGKYDRNLAVVVNFKADCPNLFEFLNVDYGLEVTDNLVYETDDNRTVSYTPFNPVGDIASSDFTKGLEGKYALTPACRQILTNKENNAENSLYNVDVITFPESAKLVKMADALSQKSEEEELKQTDAKEYPVIGMAYATKRGVDADSKEYKTNVLISGSQQALQAEVLEMSSFENEKTLLSILNGFTGNKTSITISSKSLDKTNLEFVTGQQNIFFLIFVVIIPLALLAVGIVVFNRRRHL